jgi:UDP-N-acetylmuramate dehydrogenase
MFYGIAIVRSYASQFSEKCILKLMDLQQNVPLSNYSTMKLGGPAAYLLEVNDQQTMINAIQQAKKYKLPIIMIGGGSNTLWQDQGFPGLVIVNRISGFEVISEDETGTYINIGAGEIWDNAVEKTVNMGLSGIECLSLIPGRAGATPIQNVGAYGQDISQTLVTITAYDSTQDSLVTIPTSDCNFGYRKSRFNNEDKDRFFITNITLLLTKINPMPPFYSSLANYLTKNNITTYTPAILRQAVINIRKSKLPDPDVIPNCGSFFGNPIIDLSTFAIIEEQYPYIPHWPTSKGTVKLSAAWLIDQVGFHDYYDNETGIATYSYQSLVFINKSAKSTADLLKFASKVNTAVQERFNITLTREPLLLP